MPSSDTISDDALAEALENGRKLFAQQCDFVIGAAGSDAHVLSVAEWCEESIGFDRLPPVVN